jgi:hypothetical protein
MSEKERLLRSTVPPTTLDGIIIEKRQLLRSAVPPTTLAGRRSWKESLMS